VSSIFAEAVAGWASISGSSSLPAPTQLNAQWRSANVEMLLENDELVIERQGAKLIDALLAMVTSEPDFHGDAARQFMQHRTDCKKTLVYLVESYIALFRVKDDESQREEDDDDDEDARLRASVDAAFDFDQELADDPSYAPRDDEEAKVERKAVLDLDEIEQKRVAEFAVIAKRVVRKFAETVSGYFSQEKGIDLPARLAMDRRKVIYVAHFELDEYLVNSRRQLGNVMSSNFYLSDFAHVHGRLYIGDAGGAFHAGPAGFTLVVNCASGEVPNYYAACPNRVTYVLSSSWRAKWNKCFIARRLGLCASGCQRAY
jgi:hypothetical protein